MTRITKHPVFDGQDGLHVLGRNSSIHSAAPSPRSRHGHLTALIVARIRPMRWWNPDWDAVPVAIGPAPRARATGWPSLLLRRRPSRLRPPRWCTPVVSSDPHRIVGSSPGGPSGTSSREHPLVPGPSGRGGRTGNCASADGLSSVAAR